MIFIIYHGFKSIIIIYKYSIESVRRNSWRSFFFVFIFNFKMRFLNLCFLFVAVQPPPTRSWLRLSSPNTTQPTAIFTIMNYNILCDKYATRHVYGYCPSWALKWDYRRKQILEELRSYSADIIALQVRWKQKFRLFVFGRVLQSNPIL